MCANELPGHLHVPTGLVNEGQVEGYLPRQIHLIVWHALQEDESRTETEGRMERGGKDFDYSCTVLAQYNTKLRNLSYCCSRGTLNHPRMSTLQEKCTHLQDRLTHLAGTLSQSHGQPWDKWPAQVVSTPVVS